MNLTGIFKLQDYVLSRVLLEERVLDNPKSLRLKNRDHSV